MNSFNRLHSWLRRFSVPMSLLVFILSVLIFFSPAFSPQVQAHTLPNGVNHNTTLSYLPDSSQIHVDYELYMFFQDIETFYNSFDKDGTKSLTQEEIDYYKDLIKQSVYLKINETPVYVSSIINMTDHRSVQDTIYSSVYFTMVFDIPQELKAQELQPYVVNTYQVQTNDKQDWNLIIGKNVQLVGNYTADSTQRQFKILNVNTGIPSGSSSGLLGGLNLFERTKSTLEMFLSSEKTQPLVLVYLFALALIFGIAHTFTPGHGKAVISAYMAAVHGTIKDAAIIATSMTISHTGIVILLSIIFVFFRKAVSFVIPLVNVPITIPSISLKEYLPYLPTISGIAIILVSIYMLINRIKNYSDWKVHKALHDAGLEHHHDQAHTHKHSHLHPEHHEEHHHHGHKQGDKHSHNEHHHFDSSEPGLEHSHSHGAYTHSHVPTHKLTVKEGIWLGISTGFNPCVDAITLLILSINLGAAVLGLGLLLTFSAGMALTLIGMGWVIGKGIRFGVSKSNSSRGEQVLQILPIISTLLVMLTGLLLVI